MHTKVITVNINTATKVIEPQLSELTVRKGANSMLVKLGIHRYYSATLIKYTLVDKML